MRAVLTSLVVLSLALPGCATKRYGRLQPLTAAESQYLDCPAIEVEIAKVEGFRQQVADGARFNGASAMGFLGDWGIGNANEKNAAERTATQRMQGLLELRARKRCGVAIAPPGSAGAEAASSAVPVEPRPAPAPTARPQSGRFGNGKVKCATC